MNSAHETWHYRENFANSRIRLNLYLSSSPTGLAQRHGRRLRCRQHHEGILISSPDMQAQCKATTNQQETQNHKISRLGPTQTSLVQNERLQEIRSVSQELTNIDIFLIAITPVARGLQRLVIFEFGTPHLRPRSIVIHFEPNAVLRRTTRGKTSPINAEGYATQL